MTPSLIEMDSLPSLEGTFTNLICFYIAQYTFITYSQLVDCYARSDERDLRLFRNVLTHLVIIAST